jgi:hypothetical protein
VPRTELPDRDDLELACCPDEVDDPACDGLVHEDVGDGPPQEHDVGEVDHGSSRLSG